MKEQREREWDVYYNGKNEGTVFAKTEEEARNAAFSKIWVGEDVDEFELSVNPRN